jgi:hypothetical protein
MQTIGSSVAKLALHETVPAGLCASPAGQAATCGSLMLGWSTALIFAAISRAVDRGQA